jgi:spermidine synthase
MAKGFASPKLTVIVSDGFEYLKEHTNEFDVIITDSTDPEGKFNREKRKLSY